MLIWLPLLAGAGGLAALVGGFVTNQGFAFYAGLCVLIGALGVGAFVVQRARIRRLPQLALTLLSAMVAFGLLESAWALRDALRPGPGVFGADFHPYDAARTDRATFDSWWSLHLRRWAQLDPELVMKDPSGLNPYVLIPGAVVQKGAATLEVNSLGFRGPPIALEKGDRFRIVALGESTTFGITVNAGDRSWPAVLEERIARELECDAPIEVINGGVPGWTLSNQIARLSRDVFPLRPDLLISYHGYNGFPFFLSEIEGFHFSGVSTIRSRPSRIFAVVERDLHVRRVLAAQPSLQADRLAGSEVVFDDNAYARLYAELAQVGLEHGTAVALCNFSMAVNAKSPEEAIRFFEERYADLRTLIVANRLHSRIVEGVAATSGAIAIDTSPSLDGNYRDDYVDLVHFTQSGRDRLAGNVLDGLRTALRDHPRLHCRERDGAARS